MSTIRKLKCYEDALRTWKEYGGLDGQGGTWDHHARKYNPASQPTPESFGIDDVFTLRLAAQIKANILKLEAKS